MKFRLTLLLALLLPSVALAGNPFETNFSNSSFKQEEPVTAELILSADRFEAGKSYPILVKMVIGEKYHINSESPLKKSLIATKLDIKTSDGAVIAGRIIYPRSELKKFSFSEDKLAVFDGTAYISSTLTFSEGVASDVYITANLHYQACTDNICLMPKTVELTAKLVTGAGGTEINKKVFEEHWGDKKDSMLSSLRSSSGLALLLLVFLGGLALNLTPCVYPLIPVTVGFFGAATDRPKSQTVTHAFVYLLGMAVIYSTLGTFAAVTGSLFGEFMQNNFVILFLVAVMLALSLSMFGYYEIKVPSSLLNASMKSYGGYFGTFFMGATAGIIAAPCVGPFVIGLLTFVGESQDPLLGFTLFFALAVGLGLPFVALAIFSGSISALPKSGVWLEWIRKFFGVVLVGMALYFGQPLIPEKILMLLAAVIAIGGAIYLLIAGKGVGGKVFKIFSIGIPVLLMVFGGTFLKTALIKKATLEFAPYSRSVMEASFKSGKPTILYFTADWCVPCRELKVFTFGHESVLAESDNFNAVIVDLSKVSEEEKMQKKKFGVKGVPTIIFFDNSGLETGRTTGFITAQELLQAL